MKYFSMLLAGCAIVLGVFGVVMATKLQTKDALEKAFEARCLVKQGVYVEARNGVMCMKPETLIEVGE